MLRMEDLGWGQEDLGRKETMISAKDQGSTGYLERLYGPEEGEKSANPTKLMLRFLQNWKMGKGMGKVGWG